MPMVEQRLKIPVGQGQYALAVRYWPGKKQPIVLLNGSLFNQNQFAILRKFGFNRLLSKHSLISFDDGGTGGSDSAPAWSIDRLVAELGAVVDALSPAEPVHLFGLSKGTIVAQAFAAQFPRKVASIGGYGFFHFGYSDQARIEHFFRYRLRHFATLSDQPLQPLTEERFKQLWSDIDAYVLSESHRSISFVLRPILQKLFFHLLTPTPLTTQYRWFEYAVSMFAECPTFFAQHKAVLAQIPMQIQHSSGDGTLPYAMAQELASALGANATLISYAAPYNHVSPALIPWQAFRVVRAYRNFLEEKE